MKKTACFLFVALVSCFLFGGCAEKKDCFHQCYEESLGRFGDSCGYALELTEEECAAWRCDVEGRRQVRVSWGELPDWCPEDPRLPHSATSSQ